MIKVTPITDSAMLPGYVRVAAEINYGRSHWWRKEQKETLWFDLPESQIEAVNRPGDGWLLALLPLAFQLGEPLRIAAQVDEQLLANATQLQNVWAEWFPPLKPVSVEAESLPSPPEKSGAGKTGLFFTGGVDSFFSLLHSDEMAAAEHQIDDLIFVWGYDIPLTNRAAFERKNRSLQKVAARLGKNLIPIVSNLRQTQIERLDWGLRTHGPALGAVGLLLGARFKTILFSSSQSPAALNPWGSHRRTTPLMSSGTTRFTEYGGNFCRFDKTEYIARSEVALAHLQVCWREAADTNCGCCEKCYRTLLALELVGRRALATTFPQHDFSLKKIADIKLTNWLTVALFEEILKAARAKGRMDVALAVEACVETNQRAHAFKDAAPK